MDINKDFEGKFSLSRRYDLRNISKSRIGHISRRPPEPDSLINTGKLVQKLLLKQADIDKMLKIIQRKVLKGTHLPVTVKRNTDQAI